MLQSSIQLLFCILIDGDHAHIAITPRLCGGPFDNIVEVMVLCLGAEAIRSFAPAGAADVGDQMGIAAWHPEIFLASLDHASRKPEILRLTRIGCDSHED